MPKIQTIKTVNFRDVCEAGGDTDDRSEIWNEIACSHYGIQGFGNDSIFRYVLPSINGEPLSPVQQRIKDICRDAIVDEDTIYFDVSW